MLQNIFIPTKQFSGYISQLIVGISVSWTGPILPKLKDPSQSPLSVPVSDAQISLIASLLYVGAIPGKLFI